MAKTKIQWVTHTANPIRVEGPGRVWKHGYHCTKISPGCAHCYSEIANKLRGTGQPYDNRKVKFYLDLSVFDTLPKTKPCTVFVQSMGDLFHEDVEWNFIYKVFERMLIYDRHTYIVLTKRQDRLEKLMPEIWFHLQRNYPEKVFPLKNVIGMVTGENQDVIDLRVPALLRSPFAIRGVSIEPMLGAVDLAPIFDPTGHYSCGAEEPCECKSCSILHKWPQDEIGIYVRPNWVIVGAESGPKRRYCDPNNMIKVVEQCKEAGVPVFVKQIHFPNFSTGSKKIGCSDLNKTMLDWPRKLQIQQYPQLAGGF